MENETISMGLNNLKKLVEVRELKMGLDRGQVELHRCRLRWGG